MDTNKNARTILVTGASQGIGKALAEQFHAQGHQVLLVARNKERLQEVIAQLPDGDRAVALPCDITRPDEVAQLVHEVERRFGTLSLLVNNAGRQYRGRIDEDPGFLDASIADLRLNLEAPLRLTTLLLPTLIQNPDAAVINVTSSLAYAPKQSAPAYCASKAGLYALTTALRWQLEHLPIRVVEVVPPLVKTAMVEDQSKAHMTPAQVAGELIERFNRGHDVIRIGKASLLWTLQRISPALAQRVVRYG